MLTRKVLLAIMIIVGIICIGTLTTVASTSFSSRPTEISTKNGIYNSELYLEDIEKPGAAPGQ